MIRQVADDSNQALGTIVLQHVLSSENQKTQTLHPKPQQSWLRACGYLQGTWFRYLQDLPYYTMLRIPFLGLLTFRRESRTQCLSELPGRAWAFWRGASLGWEHGQFMGSPYIPLIFPAKTQGAILQNPLKKVALKKVKGPHSGTT